METEKRKLFLLMNKKSVYRNQEKTFLQNALAFLKTERCLCKMRWHFPKLKNVFAKCADISQN
jgi:hypothetical protein